MESSQRVKSFNADARGKNRLRFSTSKERSKKASADIYRSYKRRFGVTTAADREESVHRPKRRKEFEGDKDEDDKLVFDSTFDEELELAFERNASELFGEFYREIWPLVRSVPELLHHSSIVVDLLLSYMLSPESSPTEKTTPDNHIGTGERPRFVVNTATTDILHLLAVLAKDLQQEIHPFLYSKILPRIVTDLLNPPPPVESGKQAIPLDVVIVEAAFRTMSYIFQHDAEALMLESVKDGEEPCLEHMRQFYGPTLGHKRDVVRRLAAETFAPIIRKLKTDGGRKRHLKRVIRALSKTGQASVSAALKRAKSDAIDGVSLMLFETAKGISGRLHSKGSLIVRYVLDCVVGSDEEDGESVYTIASCFLRKLYLHLGNGSDPTFDDVWKELQRSVDQILKESRPRDAPLLAVTNLLREVIEFKKGLFLRDDTESSRSKAIFDMVKGLTETPHLSTMSCKVFTSTQRLFFALWNLHYTSNEFSSILQEWLNKMLKECDEAKTFEDTGRLLVVVLIETFLESRCHDTVFYQILPAIMSSIATISISDSQQARSLLFLVIPQVPLGPSDARSQTDCLIPHFFDRESLCLEVGTCTKLIDICIEQSLDDKSDDMRVLSQLTFSVRCIPFIVSAVKKDGALSEHKKKALAWITQNTGVLVPLEGVCRISDEKVVAASFLIEAFSLIVGSVQPRCSAPWLKKMVSQHAAFCWALVRQRPNSVWSLKSASALCKTLGLFQLQICDDSNTVFDILVRNLKERNHFLRLYTLRVLQSLPKRPYIVNKGELSLSDDLDEEPSFTPTTEKISSGLSGCSDLIETLLQIEDSTISVKSERSIISLITRAEVLGKSGRLPIAYAEVLAYHMLGVFYIKYASLWDSAARALCGLSKFHHKILCEAVCDALESLLKPENSPTDEDMTINLETLSFFRHCVDWASSGGQNTRLFKQKIEMVGEEGTVTLSLSTDHEKVLQEVLKIMEKVPEITAKNSRQLVPMFLDFLTTQYYQFHDSDPDSRELRLSRYVQNACAWEKKDMNRRSLQNSLISFLRAFAVVKGSGQLYLRQELLSIFFVNLSHPDSTVAETAFTCVLNFRLPYLEPYSDRLRRIFKVKELRDALLDFPLSKENEVIHQDHRKQLVPILLRILFGRLAAGSMRGTSSKDTPLARRKAIISFLAQLEIGEIFPLIYLMVRNYAPLTFELKWEDVGLASYEADLLTCFKTSESTHFVDMPIQRHQGFLNLLLVLVSHLKGKLSEFVPTFMYILIGIMKFACVGGVDEAETCSDLEDDGENEGNTSSHRRRSARALSFRCAAILMDQYALDVDFVPFTRSLWEAILDSVENLPGAVAKSNSTPTVLALLVVLSSHARLLPILKGNDEVVDNVLLCIGPLSADKAVDAVLDFVLHLLDYGEGFITGSQIVLLLRQFRARFGGFLEDSENSRNHRKTPGSIISKELSVLSIIGDMIFDGRIVLGLDNDDDAEVLDTLSGLLIRLLLNAHAHEHDQLSALAAISAMLSRIHVDVAKSHFFSLSILLKYEHWKRLSLTVRREVTAALSALALRDGSGGSLYRMSGVIEDALALHPKRIQEIDYDRVLPALSGLCEGGGGRGWASLLVSEGSSRRTDGLTQDSEPKLLTPLVHSCFSLLLNEDDTVVSRSAYSALRSLVQTASNEENVLPDKSGSSWSKFIETCVVPGARAALRCNSEQTRRHAVSLIAEVCKGFSSSLSPNLHGDLDFLRCDANPDLDFFVNILHVQIHRRCRALQRLRSRLNAASDDSIGPPLSVQSLSKVLLPLALSPIYDNSPSSDDTLAQESIATVGAIARKLSFSKYHEVLWTALNQLSRRQHNEKLLVGMICSTLDSFHFELTSADAHLSERQQTSVWRALERRVIPKIEGLLVKEISDGRGGTSRTLRPNVVLALLKLLKKFPSEYFVNKLPRLLAIVCGALKNRDSNVRDLARKALAAMTVELGTAYLSEVVKSLAVSLTEGYQLHVRIATLHYILLQIESCHRGRGDASVAFDACVPGMMDLILQDLFGSASETKDNTDASKRLVKEASGSKSSDAVEIISRLIVFCPSEPKDRSSVHTIVLPFLEKLRDPTLDPKSTTKTKECLRRVVSGLSRNPSVNVEDMLEFIYATISPVIEGQENMYENRLADAKNKAVVVVWQPSMGGTHSKKDAVTYKFLDQTQLVRVRDGASAPKLTGSARHEQKMSGDILNSPAGACAMEFGLNLLLSTLKKSRIDSDLEPRLRPFLTLLTRCICESRHNVATMIALRCTAIIFKKGIQPCEAIVNPLGSKIVDLLSAGEININTNEEMAHVCMIALMTLLKLQIPHKSGVSVESRAVLSLTDDQMDIIVSLLKEFLAISDSTTAALGVVKALQSLKFMSSGFYDLMEQILDLSVRSHRDTFRDQCANIFAQFLLDYPLARKRFEQHLRQVMLNLKYEYNDGRVSAIRLASILIDKLPSEALDQDAQLMFLPLVLQMNNDDSEECRESVSRCLLKLVDRVSVAVANSFHEYLLRWHKGDNPLLRRASLQLFGIFVEGRKEVLKFTDISVTSILECLLISLSAKDDDWEEHYFGLVSLEKVLTNLPSERINQDDRLWAAVISELSHSHLWVKLVASRLISKQLHNMDPTNIDNKSFLATRKGSLFDIAKSMCGHFGLNDNGNDTWNQLSKLAIKSLVWIARAVKNHADLFFATDALQGESGSPLEWLMTRLSNVARPKGSVRRQSIYKCFAAIQQATPLTEYLHLMLEPLHRSTLEAAGTKDYMGHEKSSEEADLAKEVMHLLEEAYDESFVQALAQVKLRARDRKDVRKTNESLSGNKVQKQVRERQRRKRRVEERRDERGGIAKKRHL